MNNFDWNQKCREHGATSTSSTACWPTAGIFRAKKILTTGLASSQHKDTPIIVLWPLIGLNHGQEEIKGLKRPKPPSLREIVLYVTKPHHQDDDPSMVNKAIFKWIRFRTRARLSHPKATSPIDFLIFTVWRSGAHLFYEVSPWGLRFTALITTALIICA